MYNSKLKDLFYGNLGVTGLETAIILIGLVVVASVFAFVVMTVGLFSSEKSKNISYEALTESTSSFIVKGGITATDVIHLGANTTFKIEMISPKGASLILERTIPKNLTKVMNLQ